MTDRPTKSEASARRGSVKEAIGKITGDSHAVEEGRSEKKAARSEASKSA